MSQTGQLVLQALLRQSSPAILVCVDNYSTTRHLLAADDVFPHLSGRILIQLSTGTPQEARENEEWLIANGTAYLDGAILGALGSVGTQNAHLLFSGTRAIFEQCQSQIKCLGRVDYAGENIGAASALDLARLCVSYGAIIGVVHGAHICESEQLSVEFYASLFADSPYMWVARNIHNDAFANPPATVKVWDDALQILRGQAQNTGINSEFPDFVSGLFERAIKAGYGNEDAAALIKVLRSNS